MADEYERTRISNYTLGGASQEEVILEIENRANLSAFKVKL